MQVSPVDCSMQNKGLRAPSSFFHLFARVFARIPGNFANNICPLPDPDQIESTFSGKPNWFNRTRSTLTQSIRSGSDKRGLCKWRFFHKFNRSGWFKFSWLELLWWWLMCSITERNKKGQVCCGVLQALRRMIRSRHRSRANRTQMADTVRTEQQVFYRAPFLPLIQ